MAWRREQEEEEEQKDDGGEGGEGRRRRKVRSQLEERENGRLPPRSPRVNGMADTPKPLPAEGGVSPRARGRERLGVPPLPPGTQQAVTEATVPAAAAPGREGGGDAGKHLEGAPGARNQDGGGEVLDRETVRAKVRRLAGCPSVNGGACERVCIHRGGCGL